MEKGTMKKGAKRLFVMWMDPSRSELAGGNVHAYAALVSPESWLGSINKRRY
jgi:hypothetical protein